MNDLDSYLPSGHQPHASEVRSLYADANKGLLLPTPSTCLHSFPHLMTMTGGFRPFEFSILCGATGTGKTTLCANFSRDLTVAGVPHFVASVETGHLDFIRRVMSAVAGRDWNTGDPVSLEELKQFHLEHGGKFDGDTMVLSLYENRLSVETLLADIAWMVKYKGTKLAIVDNLSFILEATTAANQILEMDRVVHELIIFCKRVAIHILMVMHPRKTESGRVENESDIKGSSTANQEAHNIFLWNRPHPELIKNEIAKEGDRELFIAKMRRRGKYVGRRLLMTTVDGVSYREGVIV